MNIIQIIAKKITTFAQTNGLIHANGEINQTKIAKLCGTDQRTIGRVLNGEIKELKSDTIEAIAKGIGLTVQELIGDNASSVIHDTESKHVPYLSYTTIEEWLVESKQFSVREYFPVWSQIKLGEKAFVMKITDKSMEPEFMDGSIIIVDPSANITPGAYVVAKIEKNNSYVLRRYSIKEEDKKGRPVVWLVPLNQDWPTIVINAENKVTVIGRMVYQQKSY